MPTSAQLAASRINCLKSTGPKSTSSQSAITHGLYSKAFVVAGAEPD